jgi:AcrR family transcriptional regulator
VRRIVDAAALVFDEVGLEVATTTDIASQARLSVGSVYQYFPDKQALLAAVAEHHVDHASEVLGQVLADLRLREPPLPEVVAALVGATVDVNDSELLHALLHDRSPWTEALREAVAELRAVMVVEVAQHLRRCAAPGDADVRAHLLVSATAAAVHEVVLGQPRGSARDHAVAELVDLVLEGVGPEPFRR